MAAGGTSRDDRAVPSGGEPRLCFDQKGAELLLERRAELAESLQLRALARAVCGQAKATLVLEPTELVHEAWAKISRGGHGFHIIGAAWANVSDIRFINCDAHHNANFRTRPGEDVAESLGSAVRDGIDGGLSTEQL